MYNLPIMCGIFGYVGSKNNAADIVFEGLKKLEYRGYDSWGIAVATNSKFFVEKHAGKIGEAKIGRFPHASFGIGHTRWATHGGVTDINAHPHLDCSGKIAVVHNGIIENYQEIKKTLGHRHKIISETDTELAAHLIEEYNKRYPIANAVRLAFLKFRGLSAFLVADCVNHTLIAVKNGPPLVIGIGKDEKIVGSDAYSLLSLSRKVIFLEDNQLALITKDAFTLSQSQTGKQIKPKIQQLDWKEIQITKKHFPHFMLKEIYEQPKILENILFNFDERIVHFSQLLKKFSKIYLIGCGTAYYAAVIGSYFLSLIGKKEVIALPGSEFTYKQQFLDKNTLVIVLSQSGETIDIIEPLRQAKTRGIKTAALVNVFGSSLYRLADEKIWLEAGPEICVVSTKAFSAKLGALGLIAYDLVGKFKTGKNLLRQTISEITTILKPQYQKQYLDPLAQTLSQNKDIYIIGRGISYALALETALKIKEISYLHAEGFSGGELKHGPIALIENKTPCLVLNPQDETKEETISNALEVKSRGGYIIGISQEKNPVFDAYIPVNSTRIFTPISQVVIAQLLAYKIALLKRCDPDKPRNLAKSVTVK